MSALLFLQHILGQTTAYAARCWSQPWGAFECQPFWNWVAIGSMAAGVLVLLAVNWKIIRTSFKGRAASRAVTDPGQIAPGEAGAKPNQTADAQTWDGVERRSPRSRRKIAHRKMMKKLGWMGHTEIRGELDHRLLADRRKAALDKTNPRWMGYSQIRDELDRQDAPTIPPWAKNKMGNEGS